VLAVVLQKTHTQRASTSADHHTHLLKAGL
jgi:hypothetical protein